MLSLNLLRGAFFIAVISIGGLSLLPQDAVPSTGMSDKVEHLFAYLVLAALGRAAYPHKMKLIFGFLILYGISLEIGQAFVPGRVPSFADVIANSIGVCFGLYILPLLWRKISF